MDFYDINNDPSGFISAWNNYNLLISNSDNVLQIDRRTLIMYSKLQYC